MFSASTCVSISSACCFLLCVYGACWIIRASSNGEAWSKERCPVRLVRPYILSYSGPYQSLDLTDGPHGQATSPIPNFPIWPSPSNSTGLLHARIKEVIFEWNVGCLHNAHYRVRDSHRWTDLHLYRLNKRRPTGRGVESDLHLPMSQLSHGQFLGRTF